MKAPFESAGLNGHASGFHESLRILLAEHPGGKLTQLAVALPLSIPVEFETEDDLSVVATLAAQNAFDVVIIGESLFGHEVDPVTVRSLAEASHTTPILVLGETIPELAGGIETRFLRVVCPKRLTPALLLHEIRQSLERHVMHQEGRGQPRRLACLCYLFDQMIEKMPYAVAVTDEEGVICTLNQAARHFWNPPTHDAIGQKLLANPSQERVEVLTLRPGNSRVEVAPVAIEWLGQRYYLTSMRNIMPND
jgi:PAS domain-containing protein